MKKIYKFMMILIKINNQIMINNKRKINKKNKMII